MTEIWTGLDRSTALAWHGAQHLEACERLAHNPAAALGQGDQALAQMSEVLLDRESRLAAHEIPARTVFSVPRCGTELFARA